MKNFHQFVNELFTHGYDLKNLKFQQYSTYIIFLYKKHLWILDHDKFEDNKDEVLKTLEIKNGEFDEDVNLDDFTDYVKSDRPDILLATYEKGAIYLDSAYGFRHSNLSDDLKKLKKELGYDIKVIYYKGKYHEDYAQMNLIEDKKYFHGTSLKNIRSILKFGLKPTNETNYEKVLHKDKIFFSSNLEKAFYHSIKASLNSKKFPIIIEFEIPDPTKVVEDYDVVIDVYGEDSETAEELGYTNLYVKNKMSKNTDVEADRTNFSKKFGIFGYKGRIPSSYIKNIWIDLVTYKDYIGEIIDDVPTESNEPDFLDQLNDVDVWSEIEPQNLIRILNEMEDEYYSEFSQDEDED